MSCQIAKNEHWKIMIWLSDTKCCHLAIHYVLPKILPGPNLHFRFMKNCIHTSPLGSLISTYLVVCKQVFYIGGWPAIHFLILLISVAKCQNSILRNCCYHIVNVAGQFLNHSELDFENWEMWFSNYSLFEELWLFYDLKLSHRITMVRCK